jgi:hypothetical protein
MRSFETKSLTRGIATALGEPVGTVLVSRPAALTQTATPRPASLCKAEKRLDQVPPLIDKESSTTWWALLQPPWHRVQPQLARVSLAMSRV